METSEEKYQKNEKLVYQVVKSIKYIPEKIEIEEVYQVGRMALWNAINSYEEKERTVAFSTYCFRAIQHTLINWLVSHQRTKRKDVSINMQSESYTIDEEVGFSMLVDTMKKYANEVDVEMFIDKNINKMELSELTEKYKLSKVTILKRIRTVKKTMQENMRGWDL